MIKRNCGSCTLCCTLLPVLELGKKANQKCDHLKFNKGCTIYKDKPKSCNTWSCLWLLGQAGNVKRPDISHYVVDMHPDFVKVVDKETQEITKMQVVQVWVDPKYPNAHRDKDLREYLLSLGKQGMIGLVRYNEADAITLVPPTMVSGDDWVEISSNFHEEQHSDEEIVSMS